MALPKTKQRGRPPKGGPVKETPIKNDWDRVVSSRRIKDVGGARSIVNRFIQDNVARSSIFAQTRNQLEGGLPWNPDDLIAQGAAWRANINTGDAQAARDRVLLPYWGLINDVPHRAVFEIDSTSTDCAKWEAAMSETFDDFHDDWAASYYQEFMKLCENFINFGPGIAQWPNSDSPRYNSVNVQRAYWPKNTQMNPDSWEVMALVRDVGASELYGYIRDEATTKTSKDAGWNVDAIKATIVSMGEAGSGQFPDYRDYTRYQDLLVNNDIVITTPFQPITCVWLYVKNFDGKIACHVFPQNEGTQGEDGEEHFLFEDSAIADDWKHLLGAVWYGTGTDGMIHSIKGFAIKNFFFSCVLNRIKCQMLDGISMSSGMNFQYSGETLPDESPPILNHGPVTIFPSGMQQLTIYPNLQGADNLLETPTANRDQNNAQYNQQQQQIENSDTATQAKILAGLQGQLNVAQASVFLAQVGANIYTEQVRRLRKRGNTDADAKAWVKRLRKKGVPDDVIFDTTDVRVKTGANAGMANPAAMAQKLTEDSVFFHQPGMNTDWYNATYIAFRYGSQVVNKAILPEGVDSNPVQRREAMIENNSFGQGMELPVAPSDAHFEHIQEHIKPLIPIVQQYQKTKQISPEALSAMTIGIEHTGQHMQYLSQDDTKKDQFKAVTPAFHAVQNVVQQILTQHVRSMQGGQGQGGTNSPVQGPPPPQQAAPQTAPAQPPAGKGASESISINYKDAPPDIQRQMEAKAGFRPSQIPLQTAAAAPTQ